MIAFPSTTVMDFNQCATLNDLSLGGLGVNLCLKLKETLYTVFAHHVPIIGLLLLSLQLAHYTLH